MRSLNDAEKSSSLEAALIENVRRMSPEARAIFFSLSVDYARLFPAEHPKLRLVPTPKRCVK